MTKKVALITGAGTGIGRACSVALAKEGYDLVLTGRRQELLDACAEVVTAEGREALVVTTDVGDPASVEALFSQLESRFGRLDVLFNNAGVLLDQFYESRQGNEMHLEVNTLAPYKLSHSLLPLLQKAESAVIVNTVTDGLNRKKSLKLEAFDKEKPFSKLFGAYLESKFALTLLSQELLPLSPKIRIVNVTPGPNKTPMTADSGMPIWLLPLRNLFFPKPTKGAKLLYQAAFDPVHKNVPYAYISGNKKANLRYQLSDSEKKYLLERIS